MLKLQNKIKTFFVKNGRNFYFIALGVCIGEIVIYFAVPPI